MNVVDLWGGRVPTYDYDDLDRIYGYKYVVASRLGLAIDVKNMQIMMQVRTTAAREQLRIFQISFGAALHAPLD